MEFQHIQPGTPGSKEEIAKTVLDKITGREHPLTDDEKQKLREGGYGDLIEEIENHIKDTTLPPWMH